MVAKEKDRNNVSAFETKGPRLIPHATGLRRKWMSPWEGRQYNAISGND